MMSFFITTKKNMGRVSLRCVSVLLLFAGCGSAQEYVSDYFFPLQDGNTWIYKTTYNKVDLIGDENFSTSIVETLTVSAGAKGTRFTGSLDALEFLLMYGTIQITDTGIYITDKGNPLFVWKKAEIKQGNTWSWSGEISEKGRMETWKCTCVVEGIAKEDFPHMGKQDALQVKISYEYGVSSEKEGWGRGMSVSATVWLVKAIGVIRIKEETEVGSEGEEYSETWESDLLEFKRAGDK